MPHRLTCAPRRARQPTTVVGLRSQSASSGCLASEFEQCQSSLLLPDTPARLGAANHLLDTARSERPLAASKYLQGTDWMLHRSPSQTYLLRRPAETCLNGVNNYCMCSAFDAVLRGTFTVRLDDAAITRRCQIHIDNLAFIYCLEAECHCAPRLATVLIRSGIHFERETCIIKNCYLD